MPTPRKDEEQSKFISRCISIVIGEGVEKDQATARCYSIWRESKKAKEKKSATKRRIATS